MAELNIRDLSKSFSDKKIFENVSFELQKGEKVGLIGRNGIGKSTLFKMIKRLEHFDSGSITIRSGLKIGYLEQVPKHENKTVKEILYSCFSDVIDITRKMKRIEDDLSKRPSDEKNLKVYGNLMERFVQLGGYDIDTKVAKVATGLKINDTLMDQEFDTLSGGEKTRIMLAKLLLEDPDLLLLDEPTNHLDIESLEWLETYIKQLKNTILTISHDRFFLDNTVTKIIELDSYGIETYNGNYSYYTLEKEKRFLSALKSYMTQQYQIGRMQEQIDRFLNSNSDGLHRKAHEIERRIERIEKLDKPILQKKNIYIDLSLQNRSGRRVIEFKDLTQGYGEILFEGINGEVLINDSIGIVGFNGSGKTTLIKTILGEIQPIDGSVKLGSSLKIGYLDQNSGFSDETKTLLEAFMIESELSMQNARNKLASMLFTGSDVFKKVGVLSGGEKTRLKLSIIMEKKANLLILDEPTNHLDLNARELLEEQLIDYKGTILFVSHDRYFLNRVANKIWDLSDTNLQETIGNYDDYLDQKQKVLNTNGKSNR